MILSYSMILSVNVKFDYFILLCLLTITALKRLNKTIATCELIKDTVYLFIKNNYNLISYQ